MLFNELPTAFPWYDQLEKQHRYRANGQGICDYRLINPKDSLLPFEIRRDQIRKKPITWRIHNVNTDAVVFDLTSKIGQIRYKSIGAYDYITYNGSVLTGMDLDYGFYYSKITFSGGAAAYYSEVFCVPEDRFSVTNPNTKYLKLVWWHSVDIPPFYYSDIVGLPFNPVPYFKNIVYLDSFIHASEPEITEDGTKDGNDTLIPTFQRAIINYRITDLVPDFLKVALVLMQLHDNIFLTDTRGVRSGFIYNVSTNTALEASGFLSTVEILFTQELLIINKNCNESLGQVFGTTGWI